MADCFFPAYAGVIPLAKFRLIPGGNVNDPALSDYTPIILSGKWFMCQIMNLNFICIWEMNSLAVLAKKKK